MRKVYGIYSNLDEAKKVVEELTNHGCDREKVRIVSNPNLKDGKDIENKDLKDHDKDLIEVYKDELKAGKVVVLVGENTDIDLEDSSRYNTSKEDIDTRDLGQDPMDKPYPEKQHYEKDEPIKEKPNCE